MRRSVRSSKAAWVAMLVAAGLVLADPPLAQAGRESATSQPMSRERVIALAEKRYKARVVRADLSQDESGRRVYQLRLLSEQGKIWTVRVDAATGDSL